MDSTFTLFDIIAVSIILVTAALAFLRGFVKEFFGLSNWVVASIATFYLSNPLSNLLKNKIENEMFRSLLAQSIVFAIVLIIVAIITSRLAKIISEKIPNGVNNPLGFAFGTLKGYLIISLFFAVIIMIYPQPKEEDEIQRSGIIGPSWLTQSFSYNFFEFGAEIVSPIAKSAMDMFSGDSDDTQEYENVDVKDLLDLYKGEGDSEKVEQVLEKITSHIEEKKSDKKNNNNTNEEEGGYKNKDLRKLQELMDNI